MHDCFYEFTPETDKLTFVIFGLLWANIKQIN